MTVSQDCSLEDGSVDVVMSELDFPEKDTLYSGYRDAALTAIHHEEGWDQSAPV